MQGKEDTVACPALTAEHAAAIHDDAFAFAGDARFWPRRELEALRRRRPRAPAAAGSADGAPVALWEHAATSTSISYDFYGRARVEFEIRATRLLHRAVIASAAITLRDVADAQRATEKFHRMGDLLPFRAASHCFGDAGEASPALAHDRRVSALLPASGPAARREMEAFANAMGYGLFTCFDLPLHPPGDASARHWRPPKRVSPLDDAAGDGTPRLRVLACVIRRSDVAHPSPARSLTPLHLAAFFHEGHLVDRLLHFLFADPRHRTTALCPPPSPARLDALEVVRARRRQGSGRDAAGDEHKLLLVRFREGGACALDLAILRSQAAVSAGLTGFGGGLGLGDAELLPHRHRPSRRDESLWWQRGTAIYSLTLSRHALWRPVERVAESRVAATVGRSPPATSGGTADSTDGGPLTAAIGREVAAQCRLAMLQSVPVVWALGGARAGADGLDAVRGWVGGGAALVARHPGTLAHDRKRWRAADGARRRDQDAAAPLELPEGADPGTFEALRAVLWPAVGAVPSRRAREGERHQDGLERPLPVSPWEEAVAVTPTPSTAWHAGDQGMREVLTVAASLADASGLVGATLDPAVAVDVPGRCALHYAVVSGTLPAVQRVYKADPELLDCQDGAGYTPFTLACALGRVAQAQWLAQQGVRISRAPVCAYDGTSPLAAAVVAGNLRCIAFLLRREADPGQRTAYGRTAFHGTALSPAGNSAIAMLASVPGGDIAAADRDGATALHLSAAAANPGAVHALLDAAQAAGARGTAWMRDVHGRTPLHLLHAVSEATALTAACHGLLRLLLAAAAAERAVTASSAAQHRHLRGSRREATRSSSTPRPPSPAPPTTDAGGGTARGREGRGQERGRGVYGSFSRFSRALAGVMGDRGGVSGPARSVAAGTLSEGSESGMATDAAEVDGKPPRRKQARGGGRSGRGDSRRSSRSIERANSQGSGSASSGAGQATEEEDEDEDVDVDVDVDVEDEEEDEEATATAGEEHGSLTAASGLDRVVDRAAAALARVLSLASAPRLSAVAQSGWQALGEWPPPWGAWERSGAVLRDHMLVDLRRFTVPVSSRVKAVRDRGRSASWMHPLPYAALPELEGPCDPALPVLACQSALRAVGGAWDVEKGKRSGDTLAAAADAVDRGVEEIAWFMRRHEWLEGAMDALLQHSAEERAHTGRDTPLPSVATTTPRRPSYGSATQPAPPTAAALREWAEGVGDAEVPREEPSFSQWALAQCLRVAEGCPPHQPASRSPQTASAAPTAAKAASVALAGVGGSRLGGSDAARHRGTSCGRGSLLATHARPWHHLQPLPVVTGREVARARLRLVGRVARLVAIARPAAAMACEAVGWDADAAVVQVMEAREGGEEAWAALWTRYSGYPAPPERAPLPRGSGDGALRPRQGSIMECPVCMEDVLRHQTHTLQCGHRACLRCWQRLLEAAPALHGPRFPWLTLCPHAPACRARVDEATFASLAPPRVRTRHQELVVRRFGEQTAPAVWCPNPRGCGRALLFLRTPRVRKDVVCACGHSFCSSCLLPAHGPSDCREDGLWREQEQTEESSASWMLAHSKRCPECGVHIEKTTGCLHMTCREGVGGCGHQFCWRCLQPWSLHGEHTGGFYRCSLFDPEKHYDRYSLQNSGSATARQREMDRFIFYSQHRAVARANAAAMRERVGPLVIATATTAALALEGAGHALTARRDVERTRPAPSPPRTPRREPARSSEHVPSLKQRLAVMGGPAGSEAGDTVWASLVAALWRDDARRLAHTRRGASASSSSTSSSALWLALNAAEAAPAPKGTVFVALPARDAVPPSDASAPVAEAALAAYAMARETLAQLGASCEGESVDARGASASTRGLRSVQQLLRMARSLPVGADVPGVLLEPHLATSLTASGEASCGGTSLKAAASPPRPQLGSGVGPRRHTRARQAPVEEFKGEAPQGEDDTPPAAASSSLPDAARDWERTARSGGSTAVWLQREADRVAHALPLGPSCPRELRGALDSLRASFTAAPPRAHCVAALDAFAADVAARCPRRLYAVDVTALEESVLRAMPLLPDAWELAANPALLCEACAAACRDVGIPMRVVALSSRRTCDGPQAAMRCTRQVRVAQRRAAVLSSQPSPAPAPASGGEARTMGRVVVVDSRGPVRRVLSQLLSSAGCVVRTLAGAEGATLVARTASTAHFVLIGAVDVEAHRAAGVSSHAPSCGVRGHCAGCAFARALQLESSEANAPVVVLAPFLGADPAATAHKRESVGGGAAPSVRAWLPERARGAVAPSAACGGALWVPSTTLPLDALISLAQAAFPGSSPAPHWRVRAGVAWRRVREEETARDSLVSHQEYQPPLGWPPEAHRPLCLLVGSAAATAPWSRALEAMGADAIVAPSATEAASLIACLPRPDLGLFFRWRESGAAQMWVRERCALAVAVAAPTQSRRVTVDESALVEEAAQQGWSDAVAEPATLRRAGQLVGDADPVWAAAAAGFTHSPLPVQWGHGADRARSSAQRPSSEGQGEGAVGGWIPRSTSAAPYVPVAGTATAGATAAERAEQASSLVLAGQGVGVGADHGDDGSDNDPAVPVDTAPPRPGTLPSEGPAGAEGAVHPSGRGAKRHLPPLRRRRGSHNLFQEIRAADAAGGDDEAGTAAGEGVGVPQCPLTPRAGLVSGAAGSRRRSHSGREGDAGPAAASSPPLRGFAVRELELFAALLPPALPHAATPATWARTPARQLGEALERVLSRWGPGHTTAGRGDRGPLRRYAESSPPRGLYARHHRHVQRGASGAGPRPVGSDDALDAASPPPIARKWVEAASAAPVYASPPANSASSDEDRPGEPQKRRLSTNTTTAPSVLMSSASSDEHDALQWGGSSGADEGEEEPVTPVCELCDGDSPPPAGSLSRGSSQPDREARAELEEASILLRAGDEEVLREEQEEVSAEMARSRLLAQQQRQSRYHHHLRHHHHHHHHEDAGVRSSPSDDAASDDMASDDQSSSWVAVALDEAGEAGAVDTEPEPELGSGLGFGLGASAVSDTADAVVGAAGAAAPQVLSSDAAEPVSAVGEGEARSAGAEPVRASSGTATTAWGAGVIAMREFHHDTAARRLAPASPASDGNSRTSRGPAAAEAPAHDTARVNTTAGAALGARSRSGDRRPGGEQHDLSTPSLDSRTASPAPPEDWAPWARGMGGSAFDAHITLFDSASEAASSSEAHAHAIHGARAGSGAGTPLSTERGASPMEWVSMQSVASSAPSQASGEAVAVDLANSGPRAVGGLRRRDATGAASFPDLGWGTAGSTGTLSLSDSDSTATEIDTDVYGEGPSAALRRDRAAPTSRNAHLATLRARRGRLHLSSFSSSSSESPPSSSSSSASTSPSAALMELVLQQHQHTRGWLNGLQQDTDALPLDLHTHRGGGRTSQRGTGNWDLAPTVRGGEAPASMTTPPEARASARWVPPAPSTHRPGAGTESDGGSGSRANSLASLSDLRRRVRIRSMMPAGGRESPRQSPRWPAPAFQLPTHATRRQELMLHIRGPDSLPREEVPSTTLMDHPGLTARSRAARREVASRRETQAAEWARGHANPRLRSIPLLPARAGLRTEAVNEWGPAMASPLGGMALLAVLDPRAATHSARAAEVALCGSALWHSLAGMHTHLFFVHGEEDRGAEGGDDSGPESASPPGSGGADMGDVVAALGPEVEKLRGRLLSARGGGTEGKDDAFRELICRALEQPGSVGSSSDSEAGTAAGVVLSLLGHKVSDLPGVIPGAALRALASLARRGSVSSEEPPGRTRYPAAGAAHQVVRALLAPAAVVHDGPSAVGDAVWAIATVCEAHRAGGGRREETAGQSSAARSGLGMGAHGVVLQYQVSRLQAVAEMLTHVLDSPAEAVEGVGLPEPRMNADGTLALPPPRPGSSDQRGATVSARWRVALGDLPAATELDARGHAAYEALWDISHAAETASAYFYVRARSEAR